MVRFLGLLLAIIVAVAALTPCCVEEDQPGEVSIAGQHDKGEGDDGCTCSPFFACATCSGFVSTAKAISIPAPAGYEISWFEGVLPNISSAYTSAPWQPPRVA